MRILHILFDHSLPLHSGYTFRTAAILREQRAPGWETMQLTTPRHGNATGEVEDADGWRFHRTTTRRNLVSTMPGAMYLQEMRGDRPPRDRAQRVVSPGRAACAFAGAERVADAAGPATSSAYRSSMKCVPFGKMPAVDHGRTREGSLRYRASRALESYALRHADHVTTICEGLRDEIAGRGNCCRPNHRHSQRSRRLTSSGRARKPTRRCANDLASSEATVIGFAGSFYAYEGLDLLIDAAALLLPAPGPDLKLLLVGGGFQEKALKSLAAQRGIADRVVVFAGRVPHGEVQRY